MAKWGCCLLILAFLAVAALLYFGVINTVKK